MKECYLAIDIGASSGRHIIGIKENSDISLKEIYRFSNGMKESKDGLIWDLDQIYNHILLGIKKALELYPNIVSLAIDTWGVDYVVIKNGKAVKPFYAYRNSRTHNVINEVHSLINFDELYKETGTQFQEMNTIYQLYDDKKKNRLENVDSFLMIPEYFNYLLTGVIKKEYTNASTTGLLNAKNRAYSDKIINKLGFNKNLFPSLEMPGTLVGKLKDDVAKFVGGQIDVVLCPTHDTASAFEAVDMEENSIFISSGTWSLIGVKSNTPVTTKEAMDYNFANEGGVNYIRFLKNIMGMWIVNQLLKEYPELKITDVVQRCYASTFSKSFDVNNELLVSPKSMKQAICKLIDENPKKINPFDLFKSVFDSLALSYKKASDELEKILGNKFKQIYIVGGGAKNSYLNKKTEEYTGKIVVALPIEATTLGNIKYQIKRRESL